MSEPTEQQVARALERVHELFDAAPWLLDEGKPQPSIPGLLNVTWNDINALASAAAPRWADGWQLVPKEPTPEMRRAFHAAQEFVDDGGSVYSPDYQWKALLEAAPKPGDGETSDQEKSTCR